MSKFFPDMYQKSIYDIDYKKLKHSGIKCILFDLDNTCVPFHENEGNDSLKKLFNKLTKMKFKVIIFSNSPERRLKKFSNLGVEYNSSSKKPLSHSFYKILNKYNFKKGEVCIVGDQLFTDIYGGNKVGIRTCLVEPITDVDFFLTKFSRIFEGRLFKKFEKKGMLKKGKYYD